MQLSLVAAAFDNPDWLFEIKHDGFRALAYISEGKCTLVSRKNNQYKSFAALRESLAKLKATAILDGEIVCLDAEGKSQFMHLLARKAEASFYAFDLLWLAKKDVRGLPLIERAFPRIGKLRECRVTATPQFLLWVHVHVQSLDQLLKPSATDPGPRTGGRLRSRQVIHWKANRTDHFAFVGTPPGPRPTVTRARPLRDSPSGHRKDHFAHCW
jgi:hypothetical protein